MWKKFVNDRNRNIELQPIQDNQPIGLYNSGGIVNIEPQSIYEQEQQALRRTALPLDDDNKDIRNYGAFGKKWFLSNQNLGRRF